MHVLKKPRTVSPYYALLALSIGLIGFLPATAWAQTYVEVPVQAGASDGTSKAQHDLPLGQDLVVSLSGFQAGEPLQVSLYDPDGALLLRQPRNADGKGGVRGFRLWRNTGIRGCGSTLPTQAYPFLDIDAAQAWLHTAVRLEITSDTRPRLQERRFLNLVSDPQFHGFAVDPMQCPRRQFDVGDPILLDMRPGMTMPELPVYTAYVLPCGDDPWTPNDVLVDARPAYPNGQAVHGSLPLTLQLLDTAGLAAGKYGVLVRQSSAAPSSTSRVAVGEEWVSMGPFEVGPNHGDPGDEIDDWTCVVGTSVDGNPANP